MSIEGIGTVEWAFCAGKQNIAIKTKCYYVLGCKARLISPQRLFNKKTRSNWWIHLSRRQCIPTI